MDVVAQVFDFRITQTELDFAEIHLITLFPDLERENLRQFALSRLIDDYLLMNEALKKGIDLDEQEFDDAILDFMDAEMELPESTVLFNRSDRGEQIERIIRCRMINAKYVQQVSEISINDADVYAYYLESKALFTKEPEVRASHILIRGDDKQAQKKAMEIYNQIHSSEDFKKYSSICSACPSGSNSGDLGYFRRGIMLPEFDDVAFNLQINEISKPFKSCYGYHILMVTDKREGSIVPFESINSSLHDTLVDIKLNLTVKRLLKNIQQRYADAIKIF